MAITAIISNATAAVSGAGKEFTTTDRGFWLHSEGLLSFEHCKLLGKGPSGNYRECTNERAVIQLSAFPNSIFVDLPAGTYRLDKMATENAVYVGWEQA